MHPRQNKQCITIGIARHFYEDDLHAHAQTR